ncbi:MAG: FAD-binding oxidoreductase [Pseudomonadota bacterium]
MNELIRRALKDVTLFPFWLDNPEAPTVEPQLIGRTEADLVIVGGGYTGLWAAIQAKEADLRRDVVLIEASKVAYGASGCPGGIVSTSVMHGLSNALRIFPKDLEALEQLGHDNMQGFLKALDDYNIDSHAEWNGELTVAVGAENVSALNQEYQLHIEHDHDAELLNREAVRAQIDSPLYYGGVWSKKNSGIVNPARLAWGLKKAALSLGVRLHEISPMIELVDQGFSLLVRTHDGEVRAPKVLLATNAVAAGHPKIHQRVAAIRDRIIATEPLSDEQLARIGWTNRQGVYDTRTQLNYTRLSRDNRIIFGGRLGYFYHNNTDPDVDRQPQIYERLAGTFFNTFPQLDDVRFTHAWSGPIGLTTRMAVHFQRYYGNKAIYAGGYSGFGISASRFGARIGLALLDGSDTPETKLDLATTMPNWMPPEPFRWIGAMITMYALDTADEKGGWRRPWLKFVTRLGFPLS